MNEPAPAASPDGKDACELPAFLLDQGASVSTWSARGQHMVSTWSAPAASPKKKTRANCQLFCWIRLLWQATLNGGTQTKDRLEISSVRRGI